MPRRTTTTTTEATDELVTTRELDARMGTVFSELRWQRWLLFALVAVTLSPKVGGPAAPTVAAKVIEKAPVVLAERF